MNLQAFIEGLMLLQLHYNDPEGFHIGSEHDQFYAYATDIPLTEPEVARMKELGWFQPEADPDDAEYDQNDGWSAFT